MSQEMNLQDFACACSDLMWGGELGWDRTYGLNHLYIAIAAKVKPPPNKGKCNVCVCKGDRRFIIKKDQWVCKQCGLPEKAQR